MKTLKIIGKVCFGLLICVSLLLTVLNIHYVYFVNDSTSGVVYIDDQSPVDLVEKIDSLTEEEVDEYEDRKLFEVNYYSNDAKNGAVLQEMKMNYFTDPSLELSACRSTGMQTTTDMTLEPDYTEVISSLTVSEITDIKWGYANTVDAPEIVKNTFVSNDSYVPTGFDYYDTTDMISWDGGYGLATQLNRETPFIIKIDDEAYRIKLDGHFSYKWWKLGISKWLGAPPTEEGVNEDSVGARYDYAFVFVDLMKAVKTNSEGYGDYYITVDLSKYFTKIEKYNIEDGTWNALPDVDLVKNYAVIKFHYDENGAKNSTQSLFGIINDIPAYDLDSDDTDTDYWQAQVVSKLDEEDLSYRYSTAYGGYLVSIPTALRNKFDGMPNTRVVITIDTLSSYLSLNEITIKGIDFDGFANFKIDTLQIKGLSQSFYILDNSLIDTNLVTLKHSSGVKLEISDNAINSEYVEVVI